MSSHLKHAVGLLLVLSALAPSETLAAQSRLLTVAEDSVAAVQRTTGTTTAFAFGADGGLVVAGSGGAFVQAVTSTGKAFTGEITASREGLGVAHVSGLPLAPLVASRASTVPHGTPRYVLGPPLGYEAARIRAVRMPTVRLTAPNLQVVDGRLPSSFVGAPVVTAHGTLIGSVANVSAGRWEFAPLALLEELAAVHHGQDVPLISIIVGAFVVFLAGTTFGLSRSKRRRDRELALRSRQRRARGAGERRADGPLVRLRTPSEDQETPSEEDDDFEVVVKPPREDS